MDPVNRELTRRRLDVPEVHHLLDVLDRMVCQWADTEEGSPERAGLWRAVHSAAGELVDVAYPEPLGYRISHWIRPYDPKRDARCWRWRRLPCLVLDVGGGVTR